MFCPVPCEHHVISSCRAAKLYCKMLFLMKQKKKETLNKIMFCKCFFKHAAQPVWTCLLLSKSGIEIFSCNLDARIHISGADCTPFCVCMCAWVSYCRKNPFSFPWLLKFMQLAGISSCNCELLDVNPNTFFLCGHGISNRGEETKGQNSLLGYINKSSDYCCPSSLSLQ